MAEEQEKIKAEGRVLTQTELDAIANISYQDLVKASEGFDKVNPKYKGLLRCRQLPRPF